MILNQGSIAAFQKINLLVNCTSRKLYSACTVRIHTPLISKLKFWGYEISPEIRSAPNPFHTYRIQLLSVSHRTLHFQFITFQFYLWSPSKPLLEEVQYYQVTCTHITHARTSFFPISFQLLIGNRKVSVIQLQPNSLSLLFTEPFWPD